MSRRTWAFYCVVVVAWATTVYAWFYWRDYEFADDHFNVVCHAFHPNLANCLQRNWAEITIWDRVIEKHLYQWPLVAASLVVVLLASFVWSGWGARRTKL